MKLKQRILLTFDRSTRWLPHPEPRTIPDDNYDHIRDLPFEVSHALVFLLPAHTLVMQGARRYGSHHPFVEALNKGPENLSQFYDAFQPRNLAEMYNIEKRGEIGESLPPWELPWLKQFRKPPSPELGLDASHGVSLYGPCSKKKVRVEYERLRSLAASIRKYGYRPNLFGHIEGNFLHHGDHYRFFVQGGKHRAAVLSQFGSKSVAVRVRATWPRVISSKTVHDWPLVRCGDISKAFALKIMERYFHAK